MNKIVNVLNGEYEPISYSKNYVEQVILEKDKEIERLHHIVGKLEVCMLEKLGSFTNLDLGIQQGWYAATEYYLDKLKELKEGK